MKDEFPNRWMYFESRKPETLLNEMFKNLRLTNDGISAGKLPVKRLIEISKCFKDLRPEIGHKLPEILQPDTSSVSRLVRLANQNGSATRKSLPERLREVRLGKLDK